MEYPHGVLHVFGSILCSCAHSSVVLCQAVENNSPAFEAGLRPGDLITHINEEAIHSLLHTQVVQLILRGKGELRIRCMPLESSSIQMGKLFSHIVLYKDIIFLLPVKRLKESPDGWFVC